MGLASACPLSKNSLDTFPTMSIIIFDSLMYFVIFVKITYSKNCVLLSGGSASHSHTVWNLGAIAAWLSPSLTSMQSVSLT